MTVNSAIIASNWFLEGLSQLQSRELKTQQELSSGYRVATAADDPAQISDLVSLESSLSRTQTYQESLAGMQAQASAADGAIGSAISLISNAQSLAVQGASSLSSASSRQGLALQIASIREQLVSLADVQVGSRYVFGGDQPAQEPYKVDETAPEGVVAESGASATANFVDPSGRTVFAPKSAGEIFDPQAGSAPSSGNAFAALQSLEVALNSNDSAGIATAIDSMNSVVDWLNTQQTYYGSAGERITNETNAASKQATDLATDISSIRDADVASAATDLAQESTAQTAAMQAEAQMPQKSLFSYLA